jgi:hypothetical protein
MRFSVVKVFGQAGIKKNRHRWRFFEVLLDLVLLLREPAATPPPLGWNC